MILPHKDISNSVAIFRAKIHFSIGPFSVQIQSNLQLFYWILWAFDHDRNTHKSRLSDVLWLAKPNSQLSLGAIKGARKMKKRRTGNKHIFG